MTRRLELTATLDGDELYPGEGNLPFAGLITSLSAPGERIALSLSVRGATVRYRRSGNSRGHGPSSCLDRYGVSFFQSDLDSR